MFAVWSLSTEGLVKLAEVIGDSKYSSSAQAHACQLMISEHRLEEVKAILLNLSDLERHLIVSELAPRLWAIARIDDPMAIPSYRQTTAKDAMFHCLDLSDEATEAILAEYLVEYFVGGYYEGRATAGEVRGARVMMKLGQVAAGPLLTRIQGLLDAPADANGLRLRIGNRILRAIALTGSPQALRFLMRLYREPNPDPTIADRVIAALNLAYVASDDGVLADSRALHAIADELAAIAQTVEVKPLVEVLRRASID